LTLLGVCSLVKPEIATAYGLAHPD